MLSRTFVVTLILMMPSIALAQPGNKDRASRPKSIISNYAYANESERQKLDFWRAKSATPTPVVLMIHGGGWRNGDKSLFRKIHLRPFLSAGISVAAINYRLIAQAMEQGVEPPVKACLYDAARALQTIRAKAEEWNVDPDRIGATGSSAGACTSLWLALHDELAEPESGDPIARQSTRLACAAVLGAQTSLDPIEIRRWIPNAEYGGHAFGFAVNENTRPEQFALLLANREKVLPWIKEYSPIEWVSPDDPPIYLDYPNQKQPPKRGQEEPDPTHSAMYGVALAEKLEEAGVEAVLAYPDRKDEKYRSPTRFLIEKLKQE